MIKEYEFSIERSKDDFNVIKIFKENKVVYIGSKYRMKDKIDEFIKNISKDSKDGSIFIIFGIGSGECIRELIGVYPKSQIVIFEPNVKLINYIKQGSVKYSFLQNENINLINGIEEDIRSVLRDIIPEHEITKVKYYWILNYDKIYPKEFYKFTKLVKEVLSDRAISTNTNIAFSEIWFKTLTDNLKYIVNSTYVDMYKDKYNNIPAIIVSAGPSLSKNIDELKNINKNMLILSGGRTLRPLLERAIDPDLIGIVDPGNPSYEQVKGYIDKSKSPLLFYEGTNYNVLKEHRKSKILFTQSNLINGIFGKNITNLGCGGSIVHTLTMMAILLGCNPIVFIGQDLAYTGEKLHADIAINQFINIKENNTNNEKDKIYVEDINGEMIETSPVLDSFRRELEIIIKSNRDRLFIDATEGGAKIEGTVLMSLKDAINKYKSNQQICGINSEMHDYIDKSIVKESTVAILKRSIESADFIKNKCKEALNLLEKLDTYCKIKNNSKIDKSLRKLDVIDKEIRKKSNDLDILSNLIYPVTYAILSSYKAKSNEEIINKNKFLYESILEKVKYALVSINDTLLEIKNMEI